MSTLAQIAPRLAKAHEGRRLEILRTRPCGRIGWCCACWLKAERRSGQVAWTRHEATPWLYPYGHPGFSRRSYTLVQYHGGFRTRIYDWELAHR